MYRNGNLYAGSLWPDATVMIGPRSLGSILHDGSLWMKYPWFRAGLTGKLRITGERLDAAAPPLKVDIPSSGYPDTGFQATGLIFPTEGCWQITGQVGDTTLTFVNRVIRAD